jgi:DmsE family decaheme c-type cytochrome
MAPPSIPGATFVGSKSCVDCHEQITRDFKTADHARLQAKGKNAENVGCESCHGPGSLHVSSGGASHTIINPRRDAEACFQCHLEVRAKFNLPSHHPVLENKISCADCHNPHKGSIFKGGGATNVMDKNETCFQCHTAQRGPFVFPHAAVREGCTTCHDPHGSVNQKMLAERNQTLCLKCHFEQQTTSGTLLIGNDNHGGTTGNLTRGTCWSSGCHEAVHGSQVNSHLRY